MLWTTARLLLWLLLLLLTSVAMRDADHHCRGVAAAGMGDGSSADGGFLLVFVLQLPPPPPKPKPPPLPTLIWVWSGRRIGISWLLRRPLRQWPRAAVGGHFARGLLRGTPAEAQWRRLHVVHRAGLLSIHGL